MVAHLDFDPSCGRDAPGRLRVVEVISVGKGDDYRPRLEGQSIEITNLPSGRYLLVHRSNPARRLRESDYSNNAASALLLLSRRAGRPPSVRVLARCRASVRCPAP